MNSLWIILFLCVLSCESRLNKDVIDGIIRETLKGLPASLWKIPLQKEESCKKSSIGRMCDRFPSDSLEKKRSVCCTPIDTRIVRNALIERGELHLFGGSSFEQLPPVNSVKNQATLNFLPPVKVRKEEFDHTKHCKSYFNGTLHIIGKSTVHNVYHAVSDNVMPLISQILIDSVIDPEYLYLPRKVLTFQSVPKDGGRPIGGDIREGAPHLKLVNEIMSDGSIDMSQASGTCYRRILWGHGPHIFYVDSLQVLRRKTTLFLRLFTERLLESHRFHWPIDVSSSFSASPENKNKAILSSPMKKDKPLNIIVYTRGNSGKGRTMRDEGLIVNALQRHGANAFLCCNFANTSLEQQLYYAYQADVIMGLHGAAITHGIFMKPNTITLEWKTLYGYDSILFPLIADSRNGIHAQVDIRKYFVPGGHRPMDALLVERVMNVLSDAFELQQQLLMKHNNKTTSFHDICSHDVILKSNAKSKWPGDLVIAPHCVQSEIDHLMGPLQANQNQICKELVFQQLRSKLGKSDHSFHCDICTKYVL